jgi:hypothetical protein
MRSSAFETVRQDDGVVPYGLAELELGDVIEIFPSRDEAEAALRRSCTTSPVGLSYSPPHDWNTETGHSRSSLGHCGQAIKESRPAGLRRQAAAAAGLPRIRSS